MADYGMEVYDPAGNLVFDTRKKGWVLIDIFNVGSGASVTKDYPAYTGRTIAVIVMAQDVYRGHTAAVSGITVTVTPHTFNAMVTATLQQFNDGSAASDIAVFMR